MDEIITDNEYDEIYKLVNEIVTEDEHDFMNQLGRLKYELSTLAILALELLYNSCTNKERKELIAKLMNSYLI